MWVKEGYYYIFKDNDKAVQLSADDTMRMLMYNVKRYTFRNKVVININGNVIYIKLDAGNIELTFNNDIVTSIRCNTYNTPQVEFIDDMAKKIDDWFMYIYYSAFYDLIK